MTSAELALEFVSDGATVGLGTGRAATEFVRALGARVQKGLRVRGVATSRVTADLATELGIPLVSLDDVDAIDVTVDGADEVDPQLDLIKGYGGALVREKVVAAASRRLVIVVGAEKLVPVLGARGKLPIEVIPFAMAWCRRRLRDFRVEGEPRMAGKQIMVTDNGNHILDGRLGPIGNPAEFDQALRAIPGVVGTGLFVGMAHTVLIQDGDTVERRQRGV